MNALRKICDTGRTVVATIHQPSSTVFDMFDDLLLLKKGGKVVFYGDLGNCSCNLISYFEGLGATCMNKGENPATWMLNVLSEKIMIKGENGEDEPLDFAKAWNISLNCVDLQRRLVGAAESQDDTLEIKYESEFAVSWYERDNLMAHRLVTIYWRSPAYNLSRMVRLFYWKKFPHPFNWNSLICLHRTRVSTGVINGYCFATGQRFHPYTLK